MIKMIICFIILEILFVLYGIWIIRNIRKRKLLKYPYRCTQPDNARKNGCDYLGFNSECLMPYSGCNLQGDKEL